MDKRKLLYKNKANTTVENQTKKIRKSAEKQKALKENDFKLFTLKQVEKEKKKAVAGVLKRMKKKTNTEQLSILDANLIYALSSRGLPLKALKTIKTLIEIEENEYGNQKIINTKVSDVLKEHDYIRCIPYNANQ